MRKTKIGLMAAAIACLIGARSASACEVKGSVVCSPGAPGLAGVGVAFTLNGVTYSTTTDANGVFAVGVGYSGKTYAVTLDLTAVGGPSGVSMGDVYVGSGTLAAPFLLAPFAVDVPACFPPPPPPPTTADCSPGYYKNHPETWCSFCFAGQGCDQIVTDLSTGGAGSAAVRDAAKAQIDACFGTAQASPCKDDDP